MLPVTGVPGQPTILRCTGSRSVGIGVVTPLVGVGAPLRETHALVESCCPEALEREIVKQGTALILVCLDRRLLAQVLGGRKYSLGTTAAHTGCTRAGVVDGCCPGARALQATYDETPGAQPGRAPFESLLQFHFRVCSSSFLKHRTRRSTWILDVAVLRYAWSTIFELYTFSLSEKQIYIYLKLNASRVSVIHQLCVRVASIYSFDIEIFSSFPGYRQSIPGITKCVIRSR